MDSFSFPADIASSLISVSKEDMEKLRQALKTLSEAEKQLRMSNDRLTWLTAALLQLAPDQQYILPSSSADTSFTHSPLPLRDRDRDRDRDRPRKSNAENTELPNNVQSGNYGDVSHNGLVRGASVDRRRQAANEMVPKLPQNISNDRNRIASEELAGKFRREIEEIWLEVVEKIQINGIREFLLREGKLISVGFGAGTFISHYHII